MSVLHFVFAGFGEQFCHHLMCLIHLTPSGFHSVFLCKAGAASPYVVV